MARGKHPSQSKDRGKWHAHTPVDDPHGYGAVISDVAMGELQVPTWFSGGWACRGTRRQSKILAVEDLLNR